MLFEITGLIAWCLLILFPAGICFAIYFCLRYFDEWFYAGFVIIFMDAVILYFAVGHYSLQQHALKVAHALEMGDIKRARQAVAMMVSRDTDNMDAKAVTQATVESVLENGNDATFAPIFWYCVTGSLGVVVYRLANTLDAMWGYKTERFLHFGYFSAKIDDALNYLPARLTALSYALSGCFAKALYCWRNQSHLLASPNGGPVMTSGAGAMNLRLGGPCIYHGALQNKPVFGCGEDVKRHSIGHSLQLIKKALYWWVLIGLLITVLRAYLLGR